MRIVLAGIIAFALAGMYASVASSVSYRGETIAISSHVAPVVWALIGGLAASTWWAPTRRRLAIAATTTLAACPLLLAIGGLADAFADLDVPPGFDIPPWAFRTYMIAAYGAATLAAILRRLTPCRGTCTRSCPGGTG